MHASAHHPGMISADLFRVQCQACRRMFTSDVWDIADAGCPACGTVWVETPGATFSRDGWARTVGLRVTRNPATACDAICAKAQGLTCRCSCGGAAHGLG
jgi:hypothetical protein